MPITDWVPVLNSFISIILTGLLVLLYHRQTEIQGDQQKMMEMEQTPILEVDDWELRDDEFEMLISNHGGGIARNMGVDVSLVNRQQELLYGGTAPLRNITDGGEPSYSTSLPRYNREEIFELELEMIAAEDDSHYAISISEVLEREYSSGEYDYLYLRMLLFYENPVEGRETREIRPYPVFVRRDEGWELRSEISNPEPGDFEPGGWHPFSG